MNLKKTKGQNKGAIAKTEGDIKMKEVLYKTTHHFFPDFLKWLKNVKDPRDQKLIEYPLEHLAWVGIFLFLSKLESRRQIEFFFNTKEFIHNLNLLAKTNVKKIEDTDTLEYLLERVSPEELFRVRVKMINRLIRMRVLERFRIFNKYYKIAIDGTGHLVFNRRHCKHCLVKKKDKKILYYYHNVLDAKLICENGLALSIGTEFIENEDEMVSKQDCELRAFHRLVKKLKKEFPQLPICLLLDSLYAGGPVFDVCRDYGWKYIITFKEGSMPDVYSEYDLLKTQDKNNIKEVRDGNIFQRYNWVNDIEYKSHLLNILGCDESKVGKRGKKKELKFVWISNINIDQYNFKEIGKGGRLRWKVENEGFNIQKNGGYNLEHAYSRDTVGIKNFYLLMQIAHIISQLMEKGSLLKEQIQKVFGSIRNIARKLLEDFRVNFLSLDEYQKLISVPFQIRFSSA